MLKITSYLRTSVTALFVLFFGVSVVANASTTVLDFFNAPNQPAGFVVFDSVGENPVDAGELFLACGPNDVEDEDISYRLFYSLTDASPADPTTAEEYTFGDTPGDGGGITAFGFVLTGLNPGEEYTFWLYQFDNSTNTFSEPAVASEVAGNDDDGDDDNGDDPDPDPADLEIVQDFENEASFSITDFEGLAGASVEQAPEGDNGNSLKLESIDTGNPWQGAFVDQTDIFLDLTNNLTVEVDVYATQAFNLLLKLENGGPDAAASQSYTTPNTWQTLTFTMNESLDGTGVADGIYERVVFFPNWNDTDTGFGDPSTFTIYIDNITSVASVGDDNGDDDNGEIGEESVEVDASANWLGFANVFELPENGGEFIFASEWGLADIRTDLDSDNNTVTLFPNFNTYADNPEDPFWVDQTTQEGNKTFEGVSFIESTELAGNVLEFSGNVESFTLSTEYEVTAFIRVFNADFSFNKSVVADLTETGNFELVYDDVDLENDVTVQYGFTVVGPNANPDDLATLGNVVIGPPSLSNTQFDELELSVYPNPVNNVLKIQSASDFSSVELYNMNGRLMTKQANSNDINMQDFSSGVYLLKLTTNNGQSVTKKIIKR